ncbi:MAG TPA: peptidase, partial [Pirellulales bacterium]
MVAAGRPALPRALLLIAAWLALPSTLFASSVTLKDGRRLDGSIGKVAKLAQNPAAGGAQGPAIITFVDDDLRRVFVPQGQIAAVNQVNVGDIKERIAIKQNVALAGGRVSRLGPIVKITPFDDRGRRTFSMMTSKGRVDIIQGITQITPRYTKVEGLTTAKQTPLMCDMRIATSSIPREILHAILSRAIDPKVLEQRLRIVRLFLQQDRFLDAQVELEGIIADFPNKQELNKVVQDLRQLHARSIVKEIEVRRKAGQHQVAFLL